MARGDSNALTGAVRSPMRRSHNSRPYARHENGAAAPPSAFNSSSLSGSTGGLTRSTSASSLVTGLGGGLKSLFTRPLAWLATPTKTPGPAPSGTKRDQMSPDPEDPPSPSERRVKRVRRASPDKKAAGPYEPSSLAGSALPPLPASVTLSRSHGRASGRASLSTSASMPYLDPPKSLLEPSAPPTSSLRANRPRTSLARSSTMNFSALDDFGEASTSTPNRRSTLGGPKASTSGERENWSPWKDRTQSSTLTPRQSLPASPFASTRGLVRSQTLQSVREDSVASDVSMSGSLRAGSGFGSFAGRSRLLPKSTSMRFDSVAEDDDDRMSVVSDRNDFFGDRAARRASATPVSRLSVLPSHSKPVTEPKMVYVPGRGFVKPSQAETDAKPKPRNDADRILEALEKSRNSSSSALPAALVGQSTRQLRKAIAVPLATSASTGPRAGHKQDWLSHGGGVSSAISPYGRRRAVDHEAREQRRQLRASREAAESEVSDMDVDGSASQASASRSSMRRSTRSRSMLSVSESGASSASDVRSPSPPRRSVRRSTRSKGAVSEDETPKAVRRSTRLRAVKEAKSPSKPAASPRKRGGKSPAVETPRVSRRRKATTPPPEREASAEPEPAPAASVPVIKETAPSPASKDGGYQVRDDSAPRERSSLRAGPTRNRQHQGAASYSSSRATSPGAGTSGRFSAREEDLPDMEELEKLSKASTANFSGFSMPSFGQIGQKSAEPKESGQLSSRISVAPPPAQPALSVPSTAPSSSSLKPALSGRLGSTRPRASSPLASSSFIAEPDTPEKEKEKEKEADKPTQPLAPPPGGFFSLTGSGASTPAPGLTPPVTGAAPVSDFFSKPPSPKKKDASLGLGKPSTPPAGGIPNFFGGSTTPTVAPPKAPVFDFGIKAADKPAEAPKAGFSFGATAATSATDKPAETPKAGFSFGAASAAPATEAPKSGGFSFGAASTPAADKPAEAKAGGFTFGAASATADKPAEAPKAGGFSFGAASTTADKPAEAPKASGFSFGATSTPAADKPAEAPKAAGFSFGPTSTPAAGKPAEAPKPFSFGSSATATPAADKPAEAPKPAFSFGSTSAPAPPAANGDKPAPSFSFGAPAAPASTSSGFGGASSTPASTGFSFGGEKKADSASPSTSSFTFGSTSAAPAPTTGSGFGAASSTPASTGFGKTNGDAAKPFSFGSASTTTPAASSTGFGGFGSTNAAVPASTSFGSSPTISNASGFGATTPTAGGFGTSTGTGFGAGSTTGGFGSTGGSAPSSATKPAFSFGAPSSTVPASGGFGSTPAPATGGFGSTPAPAASGFNFGSTAGTTSRPGSSGFSFGAPAPTSGGTTPTPTAAPSFQFGAPSSTSTGGSTFQFGSSSTAPPSGTFQFGAGTGGAAPAPAPGAPRFGSPAPAGDGFSLGMGEQPGSPAGGRKIKPLRRGAVKR